MKKFPMSMYATPQDLYEAKAEYYQEEFERLESILSVIRDNNPKVEPFRSQGFLNKDYDMGRVYIDLPIIEANKLINKLKEGT